MSEFHNLKIKEKIKETEDSYSFIFEIPDNLSESYSFIPGQYLTLKAKVNGEDIRRAYSIFTAPFEGRFGCTVKRVKGGRMSNHLIDNLNAGDNIDVHTPDGKFIVKPSHDMGRDHYFVVAGSGITPVMSMILSILEEEPKSNIYLFYGNRNEESIIFKDSLKELEEKYQNQLSVCYILSRPSTEKSKGLAGMLGKKKTKWEGWKGRIDASRLQTFFDDNPSKTGDDFYYLCGPGGLIEECRKFLLNRGIDKSRILREYFSNPDQQDLEKDTAKVLSGACHAEIILNGETFEVTVPENKTILETLMDMGKDPPYSCTSGACSTCVARLHEGDVVMDACFALDEEEVESGLILTCQSRPTTGKIKVEYE